MGGALRPPKHRRLMVSIQREGVPLRQTGSSGKAIRQFTQWHHFSATTNYNDLHRGLYYLDHCPARKRQDK